MRNETKVFPSLPSTPAAVITFALCECVSMCVCGWSCSADVVVRQVASRGLEAQNGEMNPEEEKKKGGGEK